jgi:hypothetical protein
MGIDGIGKPPPIAPAGAPAAPAGAGGEFGVTRAEGAAPSGELARLERGELGLDQYLDAKVDAATAHLTARLAPEQLDFVRSTLRTELESDPLLLELARRATGKTPEGSGE